MFAFISYPPIPIFTVGPLRLSLHGVFAALGFMAGAWLASRELRKRGFDVGKYQSCLTWGLVGSLIGARYSTSPVALLAGAPLSEALNPFTGNFSILGGFAGGIIGGVWRMRQLKMPVWPTLDMSAFGLAIGTVVGRIGDLTIVEHLGRATTAPWGYAIKPGYDVAPQHNGLECATAADGICGVYHHVAAYDLVGAAVLLGALFLIHRRLRLRYGQLFWIWAAWYGAQRFLLDSLRLGNGDAQVGSLTWNQVSGFALSAGAIGLLFWFDRRQPEVNAETDRTLGATLPGARQPGSVPTT
ncbi:MAG TPA: prolipoprotein diacylglyceryl transferase family protein [Acidimicrobiia bacterium]|nr:prolipoprotein diacylglyceryl transferase family protein [Acidimicrobiia bacterium]